MGQVSLQLVSVIVSDINRILYLKVIQLPEEALHTQSEEANTQLSQIKDLGVNLVALPIQTLHKLHRGVSDELKVREQCALLVSTKFKTNNQKIFVEKAQVLKEKEEISMHNQHFEEVITQQCNVLPKLNILAKS